MPDPKDGRPATPEEKAAFQAVERKGASRPKADRPPIDWALLSGHEPPARVWAIDYWLGMGHVTLLAGLGGIGKSLLAQQLGSTLALGQSFIDNVSVPRKVLFWAGEDDEHELWRRQYSIAKAMNVELAVFAENFIVHAMEDRDCAMMEQVYGEMMATSVVDELTQQINDYAADVVILDNISRLFGGSENNRHDVTTFLSLLAKAGGVRKPAILLLGHVSKAAGSEFSGSTAWENAVRSRLWFSDKKPDAAPAESEEEAATDLRYLARRKANYSSKDMRALRFADGAYVCENPSMGGGIVESISKANAERVIIRGIAKVEQLGYVPTDRHCQFFLPHLLVKYGLNEDFSKADLDRALTRTIGDGRVERITEKAKNRSSERTRLVVKANSVPE